MTILANPLLGLGSPGNRGFDGSKSGLFVLTPVRDIGTDGKIGGWTAPVSLPPTLPMSCCRQARHSGNVRLYVRPAHRGKRGTPRTGYGFCGTAKVVAQITQPNPRAAMIAKQTTVVTLRTRKLCTSRTMSGPVLRRNSVL